MWQTGARGVKKDAFKADSDPEMGDLRADLWSSASIFATTNRRPFLLTFTLRQINAREDWRTTSEKRKASNFSKYGLGTGLDALGKREGQSCTPLWLLNIEYKAMTHPLTFWWNVRVSLQLLGVFRFLLRPQAGVTTVFSCYLPMAQACWV